EVTLHDFTNKSSSIIAIANGHVSGRHIGAPLTNVGLQMLADKSYENSEFRLNYSGLSSGGKMLRSSSMFIKDDMGRPVGMLCINFDDSRFQEVSTRLLQLCHPDEFVNQNITYESNPAKLQLTETPPEGTESFHNSLFGVADEVLLQIIGDKLSPDRLTQDEKMHIVDAMDQKGVFMLKGAVGHVAEKLCCSQASIYRYLSKISRDRQDNNSK
ncbi:MAG: PAS domain-containing protein, partial [Angelakisella sp.]